MKKLIPFLLLMSLPALPVSAQEWALDGYDAVGFLEEGRALPGRSDIATVWQGRVWHFTSEENRALFESNPKSYAPEFGGMCPVMLSKGRREKGDPQIFVVVNRHTYLLRSGAARQEFESDPQAILAQAEANWDKLGRE